MTSSRKIADYIPELSATRKNKFLDVISKRQPDLTVILENINDPHNIFAIMRTCDSVGIMEIYVIKSAPFPKKKASGRKSSSSADKWVKVNRFNSVEACVQILREKNYSILSTHLSSQSKSLYEVDFQHPIALVFGNEQIGISAELLSHSDGNFNIPMAGMVPSLNVSVACAISLYEAFRQREIGGFYSGNRLTAAQQDELYNKWAKRG
jgi:tRNA (guanosine-2'-O-)-methyltransferase